MRIFFITIMLLLLLASPVGAPIIDEVIELPELEIEQPVLSIKIPNNDTRWLDSIFRTKIEKVISRMDEEYGHEVEIVEGIRGEDRQKYLYSKGRTRKGNIVTWTLESNHLTGRAADFIIDGSYTNLRSYRKLREIAREEGLNHLSMRDPGHLELPHGNN